jgi:beta-phosphoglucomutase-like phosphatase (HAD superfamily)
MNTVINSGVGIADVVPPGFTVFCDMDGTLIDTDYANYLAYRRALLEVTRGMHYVEFDHRERLTRKSLQKQIPGLADEQVDNIAVLKAKYFSDYLKETRLNNNLATFLHKCSQITLTVLVTSCSRSRALETLRYHNLIEFFARLICREDLQESRSSNKYANALTLMRTSPDAVLVYENESADIEMAILAGVPRKNIFSVQHQA